MFTTEERSREVPEGRVARFASTPSPGPKRGEAGRGRRRGPGALGGRRRPRGILLPRLARSSTHDFFAKKRGAAAGLWFGFLFSFLRDLSSPPTAWASHAPRRLVLRAEPARPAPSRRLRSEHTCPLWLAEPLRLGLVRGQWSSPAATSHVHAPHS